MNKKFYSIILFGFCILSPQLISVENGNIMNVQDNSQVLLNLSHKYISFINCIGSGEDNQGDKVSTLFAQDCKKNFNGHWVVENRESFVTDLISVYKNYGSWQLIPIDIITAPESNSIILRINIEAKSFGSNTAIVILRYDSSYLIKEIIEVFSPVQNSYTFE